MTPVDVVSGIEAGLMLLEGLARIYQDFKAAGKLTPEQAKRVEDVLAKQSESAAFVAAHEPVELPEEYK